MTPSPFKYCLRCGYCLRGLSRPRCPECARVFDPEDPDTYATEELAWYEDHAPLLGFFGGVALAVLGGGSWWLLMGTLPCLVMLLPLFGALWGYQVLARGHERNRAVVMADRR